MGNTNKEKKDLIVSFQTITRYILGFYAFINGKKKINLKTQKSKFSLTIKTDNNDDNTFYFSQNPNNKNNYSMRHGNDEPLNDFEKTELINTLFDNLNLPINYEDFASAYFSLNPKICSVNKIKDILIKRLKNITISNFITGAGITFDYNGESWAQLIKACSKSVHSLKPNLSIKKVKVPICTEDMIPAWML